MSALDPINLGLGVGLKGQPTAVSAPAGRRIAWIDGVGAYLLCWGGSLRIGGLSGEADLRIAANLAREHAVITRSGEGYLVEAAETALITSGTTNSSLGAPRPIDGATNLASEDELALFGANGPGVRFRFRMPNALTASSVLTIASEHRSQPRFDGVVLLEGACLLGPGSDAHIRCRDWPGTLVLFQRDGELFGKPSSPDVSLKGSRDGEEIVNNEGAIPASPDVHISGRGISFRLEGCGDKKN